MATLNFGSTDVKVFTPIGVSLANLSNGPGTIIALIRGTGTAGRDYAGLLNSAGSTWYHALSHDVTDHLWDDDAKVVPATATLTVGATDWHLVAVDWPSGVTQTERFHWRDQTTLGAWTHSNASTTNTGQRAGPGTGGWWRIGSVLDVPGIKDIAVVAAWAGVRFADGDYGSWTKTSDLYSSPAGTPTFLCECTATTLVDLIGGSTYSSVNSSGGALTGPDPANWTFDGIGTPSDLSAAAYLPHRFAGIG